jgi:tetratricopeptide (TPR) repeat protein
MRSICSTSSGGPAKLAQMLSDARKKNPKEPFIPEGVMEGVAYDHLQSNDTKGALEILKLNAAAYPESPNAYDGLSDAYLADGQKDLALQNAQKALELLPSDTVDPQDFKDAIKASAEQKLKQLGPAQELERTAKKNLWKGSWSTTNQNVRSAGSGSTQAKVKLWRQPHTKSQPPTRQRNFVPIYALGVTLGISRKMKEEPGRIGDNRLNRPVKWTWSRIIGKYGHLSGLRVYQEPARRSLYCLLQTY